MRLEGAGGETAGAQPASALFFDGTGQPAESPPTLISARSSVAFGLKSLGIFYTNPAFTGVVVNLSQGSAFALIEDCVITGDSVNNARALIWLEDAIEATICNCNLGGAQTAVFGVTDYSHNSNAIQIYNCQFIGTVNAPIMHPNQAWLIQGCTFEPLYSGFAGAVDCTGVGATGLSVIGCWMGDAAEGGTWIEFGGAALQVSGNVIGDSLPSFKNRQSGVTASPRSGSGLQATPPGSTSGRTASEPLEWGST